MQRHPLARAGGKHIKKNIVGLIVYHCDGATQYQKHELSQRALNGGAKLRAIDARTQRMIHLQKQHEENLTGGTANNPTSGYFVESQTGYSQIQSQL